MGDDLPGKRKLVPYFLDFIALAFAFGAVDSLLAGRSWYVVVGCLAATIVLLMVAFNWERLKTKAGSREATAVEIGFVPGIDPYVQPHGENNNTTLYRVAVTSKVDCAGVSLVVSKIEPHPPGTALTEIELMQRHDRPSFHADNRFAATFDLHQGQPKYIDVVQKNKNEDEIWITHVKQDHIGPKIPSGNYIVTLETRGPVSSRRKFAVSVDGNGVLGFKPINGQK